MFYLAWTNLRYRLLRTVVAVLSMTVGIWLAMTLRGVSQGTLASSLEELRNLDRFIMVRAPGPIFRLAQGVIDVPPETLESITRIEGVQSVVPFRFFLQQFSAEMVGMAASIPVKSAQAATDLFPVVKGEVISGPGQAQVEVGLAELLELDLGQTFTLPGLGTFTVKGHFRGRTNLSTAQMILDAETVAQNLGDARIQGVFVTVARSEQLTGIKQQIEAQFPALTADPLTIMADSIGKALNRFDQLINLIFWMSVSVAGLICGLVLLSMVSEQRRDIGILKAMGASDGGVMALILGQAIMLGLVSSLLGAALAYLAKATVMPQFFPSIHMDLTIRWLLEAVFSGVGAGILGALGSTWYALRVDPVEVLTYE